MAALLHDVVDDTRVGAAEVRRAFGPRIAGIVGQVGRLSTTAQLLRRRRRTHVGAPRSHACLLLGFVVLVMLSPAACWQESAKEGGRSGLSIAWTQFLLGYLLPKPLLFMPLIAHAAQSVERRGRAVYGGRGVIRDHMPRIAGSMRYLFSSTDCAQVCRALVGVCALAG